MPAAAQLPTFADSISVTATGAEAAADDVPLPVTVIEREAIEDAQEESVADMLRRSPGVTALRSGNEGSAVSLFTRGTESDHTLAMLDGVRLISPYFGGYDWSLLSTAGVERIEVARGPFSALWGADAIGGAVNVIPSRAESGSAATVLAEGGDDSWQRLEGTVSWADDGFDLFASGFDREGEGELANSDFANRQLVVDAGWSWDPGSRVAVLVHDVDAKLGIPFSSPGIVTPSRRQYTEQQLIAVPVRWQASEDWQLELVASHVSRGLAFRDPDDPSGFTRSDTEADTVQTRLASHHTFAAHRLTWGGEWRSDEVTDSSSFGANLTDRSSDVTSAFLQDVWQVHEDLRLIAGVRWDDAETWGSEVSPRLAAGWQVTSSIELRGAYGHAFRQPSVGELHFPFSGNPELEPEVADSWEAGVTWTGAHSQVTVNVFKTDIDQLIEFSFASYAFANVASAEITGAEMAWETQLTDRTLSSLSATWLDTEDAGGLELLRRPEWSASWTVRGDLTGRLRGDLTMLWVGERADVDPITFSRTTLEGHLTGTLALSYRLMHGLELTLRAQNLADDRYEEIAGYPAPGRRVTGGIRWKL
jgi:vitamin B12 transporter